jgi:hypothetical protein
MNKKIILSDGKTVEGNKVTAVIELNGRKILFTKDATYREVKKRKACGK